MTTDLGPAATPRPVPSPEDRMAAPRTDTPHTFRTYLDATERDQLDARAATAEQERDDALQDRDEARQTADFRQGVIYRHRQELGAAGEVLAVVRDAAERIDRALATYDTTPGETPEREDGRPERVAEDIAAAIETHFLPDNLTAIQAARIARHHATQYGQAPSSVPSRRAQGPRPGQFCTEHFSWLCQAGQGRCQGKREG